VAPAARAQREVQAAGGAEAAVRALEGGARAAKKAFVLFRSKSEIRFIGPDRAGRGEGAVGALRGDGAGTTRGAAVASRGTSCVDERLSARDRRRVRASDGTYGSPRIYAALQERVPGWRSGGSG